MLHGDEAACFVEGSFEFVTRDADVRDVEFVLGEFGAEDDETEVTVFRDDTTLTNGVKVAFSLLEIIA